MNNSTWKRFQRLSPIPYMTRFIPNSFTISRPMQYKTQFIPNNVILLIDYVRMTLINSKKLLGQDTLVFKHAVAMKNAPFMEGWIRFLDAKVQHPLTPTRHEWDSDPRNSSGYLLTSWYPAGSLASLRPVSSSSRTPHLVQEQWHLCCRNAAEARHGEDL